MSRSYKKNAVIKDHTKNMKRIFNKKVRKEKNIPNGAYYKKANCSYEICDFIIMQSFEDVLASFHEEKQAFSVFQKCVHRSSKAHSDHLMAL